MTAAQAAQLAIGVVDLIVRLLPAKERAACERHVREHFVRKHLDSLDSYARSRKR